MSLHRSLFRSAMLLLFAALIMIAAWQPVAAQIGGATLRVEGTTLVKADGTRFVVKGINVEQYRDKGCSIYTSDGYNQRNQMSLFFANEGINAVRLNFSHSWLSENANYVKRFVDMIEAYAGRGVYSMPSMHDFTGKPFTGYANTLTSLLAIINEVRVRNLEQWLIINPYNEPGGVTDWNTGTENMTWAQWVTVNKATLTYLRNTASFKGVVVLDTKYWAAQVDVPSMRDVQMHDASLLGGIPNVVFSNHWYVNIAKSNVKNALNLSNQLPMLIGEVGQYNGGEKAADPEYGGRYLVPEYPRDVARLAAPAVANGFNGIFFWIAQWCDDGQMTAGWNNYTAWNSYGQMVKTEWYSKAIGGGQDAPATLIPTAIPSATPTRTAQPPTATGTATHTRTATVQPPTLIPPTGLPAATATPVCVVIHADGATITICAK